MVNRTASLSFSLASYEAFGFFICFGLLFLSLCLTFNPSSANSALHAR